MGHTKVRCKAPLVEDENGGDNSFSGGGNDFGSTTAPTGGDSWGAGGGASAVAGADSWGGDGGASATGEADSWGAGGGGGGWS